jgi:hypothetical protein
MATRIRTLNFLPEIFQTPTNSQFLNATLDQLVAQPNLKKIQGYVGSKLGYGVNANSYYVTEPNKTRTDYQLDPSIVFTKDNLTTAKDFISYPGFIDALKLEGAITDNNSRLFESQFYSWDSFVNLDMVINYNQYYWLPEGPPVVTVTPNIVYMVGDYDVINYPTYYNLDLTSSPVIAGKNPTITLIRGGTYTFTVNQTSKFYIQGQPGLTGIDPTNPNIQTRDVLGVTNNGISQGTITFNVPLITAQDQYKFENSTTVDIVSTLTFSEIDGQTVSSIGGLDGITSLNGLSLLLYNDELVNNFYTISLSGPTNDPIINLTAGTVIPVDTTINVLYGETYGDRSFYKDPTGPVELIPYLSADLDIIYYQDEFDADKVGIIKLIESNEINYINVETEILGQTQYTSETGIQFTNGLKVKFTGNIVPESYKTGEYYVENVGTAIQLLSTSSLVTPETYTSTIDIGFDVTPFDTTPFDGASNVPVTPDYITIARNSIDKNAWSRSNRWFHIEVIKTSAFFNNDPAIVDTFGNVRNKAKRPIIEYYPNLKLFDSGIEGKQFVDFIDTRTTDAFGEVVGQPWYYPDVNVYTTATATISSTNYTPSRTCTSAADESITNTETVFVCDSTTGFNVGDIVKFTVAMPSPLASNTTYYIVEVIDGTDFKLSATENGSSFTDITFSGSYAFTWIPQSTTVTIDTDQITGTFAVDQYITDNLKVLPTNTTISALSTVGSTLYITVSWNQTTGVYFDAESNISLVSTFTNLDNFALFDGAKIVFTNDENQKDKIYVVNFYTPPSEVVPVIALTLDQNGTVLPEQQTVAIRGALNINKQFYYNGLIWDVGQTKTTVNQYPLFDILDIDGNSFGDKTIYPSSDFAGNKLFRYSVGSGPIDSVLGFALDYSSIENVGDIKFDVSINIDSFNYTNGTTPITQQVNTGYVYKYNSLTDFTRELGWQTAVSPSIQYQVFQFNYYVNNPTTTFELDVAKVADSFTNWPTIQVLVNNQILSVDQYQVTVGTDTTIVTLTDVSIVTDNIIQILVVSEQISKVAYYSIPINLSNNPFNKDIQFVNLGDIRGQYQSIFYNNVNTTGDVFGSNNYRDLGNMVPYGTKIIQNSASLAALGAQLRSPAHNLINSISYSSNEYVKFKNLLVDLVEKSDFEQRYDPAFMLDNALDQITSAKDKSLPFFWSDMLPSKSPYVSNSYTFSSTLSTGVFPLSQIYNFQTANYNGILVYLTRSVSGIRKITQLIINQDYTVSETANSLSVTITLQPNDVITINEYNQTYGSFVPNTPTKLGLYPSTIPSVVLDPNFQNPTYFIQGHDGSYNKLYGAYNAETEILEDFRDQVLLEFEKRIYNNLKLSSALPINLYDFIPGNFRTTEYSYEEFMSMYSVNFLNWIGQNRLDYRTQYYNVNNKFTYNYYQSGNKLTGAPLIQGYWRGLFEYFFDTSTPDTTPWEMLGFTNEPDWWQSRYGSAPYTSDNLVLWEDLSNGINYNNGNPVVLPEFVRPGLLQIIPVDGAGNVVAPLYNIVGVYDSKLFQRDWKIGDVSPVELSYRRSSTYPFDLIKMLALMKPAQFYNLAIDLDNYQYNEEFNQYLVNNRKHLILNEVQIYGSGTAKTSYLNWIVDYEKQYGINATENLTTLFKNLDVRLAYRLAGFSDKALLKFFVEKGSPNDNNASLLIPDESFSVLLYENQPFGRILYSGVLVQKVSTGYAVYGNSQLTTYFKTLQPKFDSYVTVTIDALTVKVANTFFEQKENIVPYRTVFNTVQEVSQFLMNYGYYLQKQGMLFDQIENGIHVTWQQMVAEFLYWAQTGWQDGSIVTLNPAARTVLIDKESTVVQPLTLQQVNFVLNQNLYPIKSVDLNVLREQTKFSVTALNEGDAISYGQFNLSNIEHGIVFNNVTIFDDLIYDPITGLRQNRIYLTGKKTAEWNGLLDADGFIYNQDNIQEWQTNRKYTKGEIVTYKNKYYVAINIVPASTTFLENYWIVTDYDKIQKGLLPNSSTRSYESTLYYDTNTANLENDADLLGFSLIGYRPRNYLNAADLSDITQVNVYKNLIKNKGSTNAISAFKGATLPQGGIQYEVYENWAIKTGEFGGVLNNNFVNLRLNQYKLTGNPAIVQLTTGVVSDGVQQAITLNNISNYSRPITNPEILATISPSEPNKVYSDAGYVNYNDVKMSSYFYSGLPVATNTKGNIVPIENFYVRDYVWLANFLESWQVFTPDSLGQVITVNNNLNNTVTITFLNPHNLTQYQPFAVVNFNAAVDGYYIVSAVVDSYRVLVSLTLDPSITQIQARGIGLKLQSQRVNKPSEINDLPLINSEFRKNTVWVDTSTDGSWAVYRKSINYALNETIEYQGSSSFGSAVAYTDNAGYIIGDKDAGKLYRYVFNPISNQYILQVPVITEGSSFGSTIVYSDDIFVVSEPSGTPKVYVYQLVENTISNTLNEIQVISAPGGITDWGSALAISGDKNWIYVSDINNNTVYVYQKSFIPTPAGSFVVGQTYTITSLGTTDFTLLGAPSNTVGVTFVTTGVGTGTGTANKTTYINTNTIDGDALGLTTSGDNFSATLATNYQGDVLVVGAPNQNYNVSVEDYGYAYVFNRYYQNIEVQSASTNNRQMFNLAWTPDTLSKTVTATTSGTNLITLNNTTNLTVNDPIIFTNGVSGTDFVNTNISTNTVYYIASISGSDITIKTARFGGTVVALQTKGSMSGNASAQNDTLFVALNGTLVEDNQYAVVGSQLAYVGSLNAGDIITVNAKEFNYMQRLSNESTPQIGVQFATSMDTNLYASEIIIGAPYQLITQDQEGAVHRFTNAGSKYGTVTGQTSVNLTTTRPLLINGYLVNLPAGNAAAAANVIVGSKITNVTASASNGILTISLVNNSIAPVNQKLILTSTDPDTLTELGFVTYIKTQTITCPHTSNRTQFGFTVKTNEFNSFVASAIVGTRFSSTTFDFTDDENQDNDTIFDNNATQFIDQYPNAGAVYMFDYVSNYNENINDPGKYIYAQSVNSNDQTYGSQPKYGTALDFNNFNVLIGTPDQDDGIVTVYTNSTRLSDWQVYRQSSKVVDIEKIANIQLFSAETNNTLVNMDYIDPLQGKILGAARQNIDFISNADPAGYNSGSNVNGKLVWGATQVGQIWFNTSNVRFVNYHQNNDIAYNSEYWATLFPGSDVAVYSWISSDVLPINYTGPGTVYDFDSYSTQFIINDQGTLTPVYFYWVRNSNIIFINQGKTLADSIIERYIASPKFSGISYFAPLLPDVFALYNSGPYINASDTLLNIGFATGNSDDLTHNQYDLIRSNYADDFLPGVPDTVDGVPISLYDRLLDSFAGLDEEGENVPDINLPKLVQTGILVRPRQSFFYNRLLALKNYIQYTNTVLLQFPITELKQFSLLFTEGAINPSTVDNPEWQGGPLPFYRTQDYWEYANWWATGYSNNTKAAYQVTYYADLSTLTVPFGTIVNVTQNNTVGVETYIYTEVGWIRIGLQNGTIQFSSLLYDYSAGKIGFGDNFFDATPFDSFPSQETRNIIRAINEQIFTDEFSIFRNKSLILLFEYIQSETLENQNYLPWLNKTSLVDVFHTIRELRPIQNLQNDNDQFLEGYIREAKPYHVVIKEFTFRYTGTDVYEGNITDFDLPAQYNTSVDNFVSPQLVYSNPDNVYTYSTTSDIWNDQNYNQWFSNRGLSLSRYENVPITYLSSYLALNTTSMSVKNINSFPVTGTVVIGNEIIQYNNIDRELGLLTELVRGVDGTAIETHIPGDQIYINLPEVLVMESGRNYVEVPDVYALIDTTVFPPPIKPALLQAIMNNGRVIGVEVIDPGKGYMTIPEIIIEPSVTLGFSTTNVSFANDDIAFTSSIDLEINTLQTGDLVQYKVVSGTNIGNLIDGQWYYVNVLQITPNLKIGLYNNIHDCYNNFNRIDLLNLGTGEYQLCMGAKAISVVTSRPTRENKTTIKFDRTSYTSQVTNWEPGGFYSAPFAETFLSSSTIQLESVDPPISNILASFNGSVFSINSVENNEQITYSSFLRSALSTSSSTDSIILDVSSTFENGSGSTVGFFIGMPIQFSGAMIGGLSSTTTYYVHSILGLDEFTVSTIAGGDPLGSPLALTTATASSPLYVSTGQIINTAVVSVNFPNIRNINATTALTNTITVPYTLVGTAGTNGFYTNLPIFFTGTEFGGIKSNQTYYVTTVIDGENFTMSETKDPNIFTLVSTDGASDTVTLEETTDTLEINEPIIFTELQIAGSLVTNFGGIVAGTTYYVIEIVNTTQIKLATSVNGSVVNLTTVASATNTTGKMTSQINTVELTSASGSMLLNMDSPVSSGQLNGQRVTFYTTSSQYVGINPTSETLIEASIRLVKNVTTLTGGIVVLNPTNQYFDDATDNFYVNMPVEFSVNIGSLTAATQYYVVTIDTIEITVTQTIAVTNILVCDTTDLMYVNMPIKFSGFSGIGGVDLNEIYFVKTIVNGTQFTISTTEGGSTLVVANGTGTMVGTGTSYVQVSTTKSGTPATTGNDSVTVSELIQTPTTAPEFSVSYIAGGYRVVITNPGEGYANNNTLVITGNLIGGTTPTNDLTLTVIDIDTDGEILKVICQGNPNDTTNSYYLKAINQTEFMLYEDNMFTIPVSGLTLPYSGIVSTTVASISSPNITLTSGTNFSVNDMVVFTGDITGGNITIGETYYILTKATNTITISTVPGGTTFAVGSPSNQSLSMAKIGSVFVITSPYEFKQSIVKFNNRLYVCIVGNNDDEFISSKWQLIQSDDVRLNALDRIMGYYSPTANMPGLNLTQLVNGIAFPYLTLLNNAFEPSQQFALDSEISDRTFTSTTPTVYDFQGATFAYGYGPEELVPGNITDSLMLQVNTTPGTVWSATEYQHVGYNVVSVELSPESGTQVEYSFNNVVQVPAQISVYLVNGSTNLAERYFDSNYTVDWVNKKIILNSPLTYLPIADRLIVNVYEVGNGNQVVKSCTDINPIITNEDSGDSEIYLDYLYYSIIDFTLQTVYTDPIVYHNGSQLVYGVDYTIEQIVPGDLNNLAKLVFTNSYDVDTDFISYTIFGSSGDASEYGYTVPEYQEFTADGIVSTFSLTNFVGQDNPDNAIVELNGLRLPDTDYTINSITNQLTVSATLNNGDIVGVTSYNNTERQYLNTEYNITGNYVYQIQTINNSITPYTAQQSPTASSAVTNKISFGSTAGMAVNQTIQFLGTAFGNVLTDGTVYFILTVVGNDITISTSLGGSTFDPGTATPSAVVAVVGGQPAVRVTFATATTFAENDRIRIDGVVGSVQLNNNLYYVKKITSSIFDLYNTAYNSGINAINDPVLSVSTYISGGFGWLRDNFLLPSAANATATTASTNIITVNDTSKLVVDTPVYFTQMIISSNPVTTFGNISDGQEYYVREIVSGTQFTISTTRGGDELSLSNATGTMNVTQWEQTNTDRLWVTLNGYKVSTNLLKINNVNELSILTSITNTDTVIITSMMPSATPNQEKFFINVNALNQPLVYRQNPSTVTWLTEDFKFTDETIYVNDVLKLVTITTQVETNISAVSGEYFIGLTADKNIINSVTVYNENTSSYISSSYYTIEVIDLVPTLIIEADPLVINDGQTLTITITEGDTIFINGEQIGFTTINVAANTITGLSRGINTTGTQNLIPKYTKVYGLLNTNKMPENYYDLEWNSYFYNSTEGDPLQISTTDSAIFLRIDSNE